MMSCVCEGDSIGKVLRHRKEFLKFSLLAAYRYNVVLRSSLKVELEAQSLHQRGF